MGRVKKEPKAVQKECEFCGDVFIAFGNQGKFCSVCKDPTYREQVKRRRSSNKVLFAFLRKIDLYNKEHGTHLSYGKYVQLVEGR